MYAGRCFHVHVEDMEGEKEHIHVYLVFVGYK